MQITEKAADGLSRTYGVVIAKADIAARLDAKLAEIAPQVSIKGFRKGKVPVAHVRRMYGKSILGDLVNELVQEGVDKAVNDNGVRPASQPEVKGFDGVGEVMDGKADLSFEVELDIMPTFEPVDIKTLTLNRPVSSATDAEVDEALAEIAKQAQSFETKKGAAKDGDQVVCDFTGKIDGVEFQGGKAEGATVVIGSGAYIPGFEEQLKGVKAGEERVLNVTFPAEYQVGDLAGKAATFETKVSEVKGPVETKIDDELAKNVGLSDLAALREVIAKNIEGELAKLSRQKAKRALLDALDVAHAFDLPQKMLNAEFEAIWNQVQADKAQGNVDPEDADKSEDELKAEYRRIAERRVRLGLVLAEVGRVNGVEVKDEEVGRAIQAEAGRFPGQEKQVFEFFQKNPQAVASIRAPLYEEKVVDFVLQMAQVTDVPVSRAELEAEDDAAPVAAEKAPAKKPAKAKKAAAEPVEATPDAEAAPAKPKKAAAKKPAADASTDAPKKAAAKKKADA
jgi:trigger factor